MRRIYHSIIRGVKSFKRKIKLTIKILTHKGEYIRKESYYKDCELKNEKQIIRDFIHIIWKFGQIDPFYFTYGFDRKEITQRRMDDEYILPYFGFEKRIKELNLENPYRKGYDRKVTTWAVMAEKYYFNVFLEKIGIPTPKIFVYLKNRELLYLCPDFKIPADISLTEQLEKLFSNDMDAFAKPSNGELGNGVFHLQIKQGKIYINNSESTIEDLISIIMSTDYLVQQCVYQHPLMNTFNSSCISTIRLQTVMDADGVVHPFGAGLRIGRKDSIIDNWAKGGVFVGINMENGKLMEMGLMKPPYGTSTKVHPDSHIPFRDFEIPYYKEAEAMAIRIHQNLFRSHSIGFDIAITENGPMFIEANGLWAISLLQAVHGGLKKQIGSYFMLDK